MVDEPGSAPSSNAGASGDRDVEFAIHFDDAVAARFDDVIRHSSSDEDEVLVILGT
jgi:hypothetical protein